MQPESISVLWNVGVNAIAWLSIHMLVSTVFARLPKKWFAGRQFAASEKEVSFYQTQLQIKRWKNRLPDGGSWMGHGFSKSRIEHNNEAYLQAYQLEAHRGEWCHLVSILPAPLFFLWNTPMIGMIMLVYALAVNLPCIFALRYNRARIVRLLDKKSAVISKDSVMQIDPGT